MDAALEVYESDGVLTFTIGADLFIFEAHPEPPVLAQWAVQAIAASGDDPAAMVRAVYAFLDAALTEPSFQRLMARLDGEGEPVTMGQVGEVTGWLVDVYMRVPGERAS